MNRRKSFYTNNGYTVLRCTSNPEEVAAICKAEREVHSLGLGLVGWMIFGWVGLLAWPAAYFLWRDGKLITNTMFFAFFFRTLFWVLA